MRRDIHTTQEYYHYVLAGGENFQAFGKIGVPKGQGSQSVLRGIMHKGSTPTGCQRCPLNISGILLWAPCFRHVPEFRGVLGASALQAACSLGQAAAACWCMTHQCVGAPGTSQCVGPPATHKLATPSAAVHWLYQLWHGLVGYERCGFGFGATLLC
jgi:hypothetical protein